MYIITIILGILCIILGMLAKRYPMLISGYNTMSEKRRSYVDIDALKKLICHSFVVGGIILIVLGIIGYWVSGNWMVIAMIIVLCGVCVAVNIISVKRGYDRHPKAGRDAYIAYAIIVAVVVGVAILLYVGDHQNCIAVDRERVQIDGMYGRTICLADVDTVFMTDRLPKVKLRTSGFADGKVMKGRFRLDEWGGCTMFVHTKGAPVIVIHDVNGGYVILNLYDAYETAQLFERIKFNWQSSTDSSHE